MTVPISNSFCPEPNKSDRRNNPEAMRRRVYTWTGDHDRAIELVQKLLTMPGYTNYGRLKFHPLWNPLRGDPRFEKIVASLAPKDQSK